MIDYRIAYYLNYCTDSNQILHNDRDHENTLRGWSKQAYNKSKMAEGRHLKKLKTAISLYLKYCHVYDR